jgi:VCBS repeat-containing protein
MKSRYVFATIITIVLVLVSIALLQVVSANNPGGWTKSWVGPASGDWGNAANWSEGTLPAPSDTVYIGPGNSVTISSSSGTDIVWLHSDSPLTISGGTLNISSTTVESVIESSFTLSGGELTGSGNVTIGGLFTWALGSGGSAPMTGTGETTANGGINITSGWYIRLYRTLNNAGTATFSGGYPFTIEAGGTFNNLEGATFDYRSDAIIQGSGAFNNYGTFSRTTSALTGPISSPFNNYSSGTVNVDSGTLSFRGNGTHEGAFDVDPAGTLDFNSGTIALSANSSVTGAGAIKFTGATVTVAGTYNPSGPTTISGGTVNFNSAVTPNALTLSGGELTGSGNVTIGGLFTWALGSGGSAPMTGTGETTANGGINITSGWYIRLYRTLNNAGTATFSGGYPFTIEAGGTFNNLEGATFDYRSDAIIQGSGAFNNYGTFSRTTSALTGPISSPFNNYSSGTVNVDSGTLSFRGNGTHEGAFDVDPAGTLDFNSGTIALSANSSVTGAGAIKFTGATVTVAGTYNPSGPTTISGGTVNFNSAVTPNALTLSGGELTGSGNVTIGGLFTWALGSGGSAPMTGTGETTANGGINITSGWYIRLYRTLNNAGTATFSGGYHFYIETGGTFNNLAGATFNYGSDTGQTYGPGNFNNAGTFNTTNTGTAHINCPFNNTGDVVVVSGVLSFGGAYTQTGGSITLKIGGTTPGSAANNYDQVQVSGAATLSGALTVTLVGSPTFVPSAGDTFTIMKYLSHSGTFATANLPALGAGLAWGAVAYNSGSVVLSVVVNNPPTAVSDAYSTNEDTALIVAPSGVLANDSDAEGYSITAVKVSDPSHGAVTLNSNGSFTYTPEANYNGSDSFTYRAYDGTDYSSTVTVAITVNAVNDAPSFTKGPDQTVLEDAGLQTVNTWATGLSAGPSDESGQVLDFIVSNNNNSLFSAQPAIAANGTLTFTPAANANGTATVTVSIHDSGGISNGGVDTSGTQTFTVTVTSVNDPPVAADDAAYSTDENAELNQAAPGVLGNDTDIDGNPLTAVLVSNVSHGTLVLKADGSFTYTPAAGFTGSDSFTCKANDGTADSNVVTVTIEVTQPEPPTISSLDHLKAAPGETIRVVITGTKLGGATEVDFGPGVTVEGLTIDSASQITVDVKVASDAQSGSRDVTVTTPQGVATLTDAFTVKKAPSGGTPVWIWPVAALAVIAAGAGGFFLFFLLPRRRAKKAD